MKNKQSKHKLIYVCLAATLWFACDKQVKQEAVMPTESSVKLDFESWLAKNKDRLDQVTWAEMIAIEDIDIQRRIFNVIPAKTKADVWHQKFAVLLKQDGFSKEQKEYIMEADRFVSEEQYTQPIATESKAHIWLGQFRDRGTKLFTREELFQVIASFSNNQKEIGKSCNCSPKNDWCDFPVDVWADCKGLCDDPTTWGCGTLGFYACSNRCAW